MRAAVGVLVAAVLIVFAQACRLDFCNDYDDGDNVSLNHDFNPVTPGSLAKYWRAPQFNLYVPVPYTAWGAIAAIARTASSDENGVTLNPYVFHAANVLVHLATVLLAFAVLRQLVGQTWPAAVGALLFAVHPVQVEPVAWITGLRDLLCGAFSLLAVLWYLRAASGGSGVLWFAAAGAFGLALLSKPSAVALPIAVAVLDLLLLKRPARRVLLMVVVGLLLTLPQLWITRHEQPAGEAGYVPPLWQRPLVAADAIAFYVGKILFPAQLLPDYGRSPWWLTHAAARYWTWAVAVAALAAIWGLRRRVPVVAGGIGWALVCLLPVLGFAPFLFQNISTVADRFFYIAMFGPALIVAWLLARWPTRWGYAAAAVVLGLLAGRSVMQVPHWQDAQALFMYELGENPDSYAAHTALGTIAQRRGDQAGLIEHVLGAARSMPDTATKFTGIAKALAAQRRCSEAVAAAERALRLDPADADAKALLEQLRGPATRP